MRKNDRRKKNIQIEGQKDRQRNRLTYKETHELSEKNKLTNKLTLSRKKIYKETNNEIE